MPEACIMVLRHGPVAGKARLADFTTSDFGDVREFKPQLAVIANPASFHAEFALLLIEMGCDLLIEKPLAISAVEGRSVFAGAEAKGSIVRVGYNLRYLPSLQFFRDQVRQSCVGRVFSIRCEVGQHLESWRVGSDYRQGVSAQSELGGGVLLELSHELDYLSWIFGPIDSVGAWLGRQSDLEVNVEDTAHLILGFQTGSVRSPVASLSLDFIRHDKTRSCIVIGERGTLVWNGVRGTVAVLFKGKTSWQLLHRTNPELDFSYLAQWEDFLAATVQRIDRLSSVAADLEQAIHVLEVVDAARASCLEGGVRVKLALRGSDGKK